MASSKVFFIIAVVAFFAIPSSLATEFVVGDEKGWSLDFDYQGWAAEKEFRIGDKLGKFSSIHREFTMCLELMELSSNNVKQQITLFCIARHCAARNMKLNITALSQVGSPSSAPTPNSTTSSAARGNTASSFYGWIVIMVSFVGVVLV